MRLLIMTWLAAHTVDIVFTIWSVEIMGIAVEANPVGFGRHWLAWPIKIGYMLLTPLLCYVLEPPKIGRLLLGLGTTFYVLIAAWNGLMIVLWVLISRGMLYLV